MVWVVLRHDSQWTLLRAHGQDVSMGQRAQCDCYPAAGSLCSEPELCLTFLALASLQDHCAVLRAFKLSDLELSISWMTSQCHLIKGKLVLREVT